MTKRRWSHHGSYNEGCTYLPSCLSYSYLGSWAERHRRRGEAALIDCRACSSVRDTFAMRNCHLMRSELPPPPAKTEHLLVPCYKNNTSTYRLGWCEWHTFRLKTFMSPYRGRLAVINLIDISTIFLKSIQSDMDSTLRNCCLLSSCFGRDN